MDAYRNDVLNFRKTVEGGEFVCFDTETTGLSPVESDIIEFSAIRYREEGGKYVEQERMDLFINPGYHIPEEVTAINGIDDAKVKDAPTTAEAARMIKNFLGEKPNLLGYNSVSFDEKFLVTLYRKHLNQEFTRGVHLDVLKMAREKLPKPHKLIDMAQLFGVAEGYTFHTSIDDALATFDVFLNILPMYEKEEAKESAAGFVITRIQRWRKSATLDRIYVNNSANISVYLNVATGEWTAEKNFDIAELEAAVFAYAGVTSKEELTKKYS